MPHRDAANGRLYSLLKNTFRGSSKRAAAEAETDSGAFTVSLKRYPDTNREFFSKLFSRCASGGQISAAKAVKLRGLLAASLKRCPDTNRFFPNCTITQFCRASSLVL
jgi:hypothetical protein